MKGLWNKLIIASFVILTSSACSTIEPTGPTDSRPIDLPLQQEGALWPNAVVACPEGELIQVVLQAEYPGMTGFAQPIETPTVQEYLSNHPNERIIHLVSLAPSDKSNPKLLVTLCR